MHGIEACISYDLPSNGRVNVDLIGAVFRCLREPRHDHSINDNFYDYLKSNMCVKKHIANTYFG